MRQTIASWTLAGLPVVPAYKTQKSQPAPRVLPRGRPYWSVSANHYTLAIHRIDKIGRLGSIEIAMRAWNDRRQDVIVTTITAPEYSGDSRTITAPLYLPGDPPNNTGPGLERAGRALLMTLRLCGALE